MGTSANQVQIPVIKTDDPNMNQVQQNVNKVLRNIHDKIPGESNSFATYEPVITNCGLVTIRNFLYRQDNDLLNVMGTFTLAGGGASPIGIPLPPDFESSADLATYQVAGVAGFNVNGTFSFATLIGPSATQFFFGIAFAGNNVLVPTNANLLGGAGVIVSVQALIPLTL